MATAPLNRLSQALTVARTLTRDARAIQTGKIAGRIRNRLVGRGLGWLGANLWKR